MPRWLVFCGMLCLALALAQPAYCGNRGSNDSTGGPSLSKLSTAGAQPMTKTQVLDFIKSKNGRLNGNINSWRDSLRLYEDGTVRGESSGAMSSAIPGIGSWSVAEDGTLTLTVRWKYGGPQNSVGKLFQQDDYVYQVDTGAPDLPWVYRFQR